MKNSMFAFGAGSRTCIGKNVSYLEMYKLVPAMLRSFDVSNPNSKHAPLIVWQIELAFPDRDWTLHNAWFVKQCNFHVKLRSKT